MTRNLRERSMMLLCPRRSVFGAGSFKGFPRHERRHLFYIGSAAVVWDAKHLK